MKRKKRPSREYDAPLHAGKTARRLFAQLGDQKLRLSLVAVSIVIYTVLNVYTPYYSAGVIDALKDAVVSAVQGGAFSIQWEPLGRGMAALFAMYIAMGCLYFFQSFLMASVAEKLILRMRRNISQKLNKLPLRFFDKNKPGEILSRVTSDLDKVSETLQTGLLKLLVAIGTIIGSVAFMFYYSWLLALIFLAFMAVGVVATQIVSKKTLRAAGRRQEAISRLTGIAEEYYTGRDIIKAYNREGESAKKVRACVDEVRITSRDTDFYINTMNPVVRFLSRISQAIILLIAGYWMLSGAMTIGVAQAYFQYIALAAEPVTEASFMINSLQSALASAERTFEFLDGEEEVPDTSSPAVIERAEGNIAFEHVNFGYSPDKILMKDISFSAARGKKIAIVGATGAGKTTLINLLMRFYEVNGGRITIDGVPTSELTRSGLRKNFGMVLQDTWLFGGTIAENIAYGRPDATREEIVRAAKMAKVDYFIRTMPQGYDTVIESDAGNLSVGQRQLITIARVFLCDPPVLILDEATSSVDTRTEAEISRAMNSLMSGRTSFVIAHRLSTIRDADSILFMENGNIIEQGTHEELLKKGGAYAALYNSQFA